MQLDIILLLHSKPRKHGVIEVDLSDDAISLFRQMSPGREYRILDFRGHGLDPVIVGWKQLMTSSLVSVVVDEDRKESQQWQTARVSLNDMGIRVHALLEEESS